MNRSGKPNESERAEDAVGASAVAPGSASRLPEAVVSGPTGERLRSASGLRPASAFVLIGVVLALVAARAAILALYADGEQPRNLRFLKSPEVTFDLVDSSGVPLSTSVDYLELVMSPNAMWAAHTPDKMSRELAEALGEPARAAEICERMLPDAHDGLITTARPPLVLDAAQAQRVQAWIAAGPLETKSQRVPIDGLRVVRTSTPDRYAIEWRPATVLSESERARHGFENPLDWTRKIADDLAAVLHGDDAPVFAANDEERRERRARVWNALMPAQFRSIQKNVPAVRAQAIHELLKDERVQDHQMSILRNAKRVYPVRGSSATTSPPLAVLGRWGTLEPDQARRLAAKELELPADDGAWTQEQTALFRDRAGLLVYQPSPMGGIELLAQHVLSAPAFGWLDRRREEYTFLHNQVPRQPSHRYFQELLPGSAAPVVTTTLEIGLQRAMRTALEKTMADNDPALAMAIAIDLATGDVLAVDAIDPYEMGGFLPTMHTFTPGSTFKVVVMASALHEGVITPATVFDAGHGHFSFQGRLIHEAEGAKDKDDVTAAEGLAYSINAVLVQIGTRVPAEVLRQHIKDLGYAVYPGSGLGGERPGYVRPLPWVTKYTHASVCFGHEIFVTLWQHAAALAAVVRGGTWLPLRLVKSVEQDGRRDELPIQGGRAVLKTSACEDVRAMMMLGAQVGTGRKVYTPDIVMGTKTGTAQKVGDELCLHVELKHNKEHGCHGASACRTALQGQKAHGGPCYTSSMCIFGHLPSGGREVMVLVVVDEPRGKHHFGSEVAGPAAIAILREALGLTCEGAPVAAADVDGFHAVDFEPKDATDRPWAEAVHATR